MPEPSAFEVKLANEKLKSHKSLGIDQIPAELIKAGGGTISYENHKLIISIWNKEELPEKWDESFISIFYNYDIEEFVVISEAFQFYQIRTNIYPTSCCQG